MVCGAAAVGPGGMGGVKGGMGGANGMEGMEGIVGGMGGAYGMEGIVGGMNWPPAAMNGTAGQAEGAAVMAAHCSIACRQFCR